VQKIPKQATNDYTMTFWGDELELKELVQTEAAPQPIHTNEVRSAFGAVDLVPAAETASQSPGSPATSAASQWNASHSPSEHDDELRAHQLTVPRLPIPALAATCELYLASLQGILSAEEFGHTQQCVERFLADGSGARLQALLVEHEAAQQGGPSWLEGWWDDAYLYGRDPIPINVNYFFGFEAHANAAHMTQVGRAASLAHAAVTVALQIRTHKFALDKERGQPLCMSQYRRVFCASRVPGEKRDTVISYSTSALLRDEETSGTCEYVHQDPSHIVVMARNRFFAVEVLSDDGADVVPLAELTKRIAEVHAAAHQDEKVVGPPVGVFTTMQRTRWWATRQRLVDMGNAAALAKMQTAFIVVVLDSLPASDHDEAARLFLHGTGTNRWFDRHNIIVTKDGTAGINFEHSVGDGAVTLRVADTMHKLDAKHCLHRDAVQAIVATAVETVAARTRRAAGGGGGGGVEELTWKLDGLLDQTMKEAYAEFVQLIQSNETKTLDFKHFGGDWIKQQKLSPDAFVQLAFQLAHFKMFGRIEATYEAASTRGFAHGRTEVVRSASRAALDFCEASALPVFTRKIGSAVPPPMALMRGATEAHTGYMRKAKAGLGVDRHLLGLRRVCADADLELPDIFADPAFARSAHWVLSTSHCGSSALTMFGFGPVVNDGFGLGYMIKNGSIGVTVTSKYTYRLAAGGVLASLLESSLLHMRAIVDCDWEKRRAQKPLALDFTHPTSLADIQYHATSGFSYKAAGPRVRSMYGSMSGAYGSGTLSSGALSSGDGERASHPEALSGSQRSPVPPPPPASHPEAVSDSERRSVPELPKPTAN
jgi:carnitine O-acetyltransferase